MLSKSDIRTVGHRG